MNLIKQSTAVTLLIGPFVDDTDGKTAETDLTISQADVRLSKNGGNMAQKNDATGCTHDELGYYTRPLNTTDTNTRGILRVMVHESGALPVWHDYQVVTANVYDTLCSTDSFDVNVTAISGDTTAADNLEADYDGTGYAKTNSTTKLHADYDAAKTAAQAGDEMDLVDAPNVTAVAAIQSGLSTLSAGDVADAVWDESTTSHTSSGTFGRLLNLLRKLLFNQQVDSGNSVENFDDDGETSLGTASWSESTGTRGKHTVAW